MLAKEDDNTFLNNLITPVNTQQQTQSTLTPWRSELAKKQGLAAMKDRSQQAPWSLQDKFSTGLDVAQTGFGIWNGIQSQKLAGRAADLAEDNYNLNKAGMLADRNYNLGVAYRRNKNLQGGVASGTEADYIKKYSGNLENLA